MSYYTKHLLANSDIREHLGLLHGLALDCNKIIELGLRSGVSTSALLASGANVTSYDNDKSCAKYANDLRKAYPHTFAWILADSRKVMIPECDMLFIDTDHTYATTKTELFRHRVSVRKWIILHDTETFGRKDRKPGTGPGIMTAIDEFTKEFCHVWRVMLHLRNNNGLTILEKHP